MSCFHYFSQHHTVSPGAQGLYGYDGQRVLNSFIESRVWFPHRPSLVSLKHLMWHKCHGISCKALLFMGMVTRRKTLACTLQKQFCLSRMDWFCGCGICRHSGFVWLGPEPLILWDASMTGVGLSHYATIHASHVKLSAPWPRNAGDTQHETETVSATAVSFFFFFWLLCFVFLAIVNIALMHFASSVSFELIFKSRIKLLNAGVRQRRSYILIYWWKGLYWMRSQWQRVQPWLKHLTDSYSHQR